MKKMITLLLCLAMALSVCSFAAAESEVPDLANTYFSYGYDVGFWMDYFFHFYDEVPGFGKIFYAGYCLNQIVYTGTYEVVAEPYEYHCWADRADVTAAGEGAEAPAGTAPYTVIFYDFDGNELDRCGLDETHLYNDMANVTGVGGDHVVYNLDTDPENSAFTGSYNGEQAVALLSLVDPDDDSATLELKVNGKYDDMVLFYVEGTFAMNEDQTVITLSPDSEGDEGATVTKNEDGTYTYVSTDGTEVTLQAVGSAEVAYRLAGKIPVPGMEGVEADLNCDLYSDNTTVLYAEFMGNRMDIDQGTYEIDMTTYSFVLHFEAAGDLTTEGFADQMVLNYAQAGHGIFGDIAQTLSFVTE
ncbi:MAG: hypothetical protein IK127_08630 [Clostridia bacterium]|nr:hypothetical protein [Clostridia bacterium]